MRLRGPETEHRANYRTAVKLAARTLRRAEKAARDGQSGCWAAISFAHAAETDLAMAGVEAHWLTERERRALWPLGRRTDRLLKELMRRCVR